jgi:hypothetical protein
MSRQSKRRGYRTRLRVQVRIWTRERVGHGCLSSVLMVTGRNATGTRGRKGERPGLHMSCMFVYWSNVSLFWRLVSLNACFFTCMLTVGALGLIVFVPLSIYCVHPHVNHFSLSFSPVLLEREKCVCVCMCVRTMTFFSSPTKHDQQRRVVTLSLYSLFPPFYRLSATEIANVKKFSALK